MFKEIHWWEGSPKSSLPPPFWSLKKIIQIIRSLRYSISRNIHHCVCVSLSVCASVCEQRELLLFSSTTCSWETFLDGGGGGILNMVAISLPYCRPEVERGNIRTCSRSWNKDIILSRIELLFDMNTHRKKDIASIFITFKLLNIFQPRITS